MKLPRIFKQRRMRGKSKSPEAKFKEKKARVDAFLLDSWLKQLRNDPSLAQRIAEQKYGVEAILGEPGDGEYEGQPDLLEVLRQAREAKELLRDEMGEGKGSTLRDIAEILKALPQFLQSLGQVDLSKIQQIQQQQQQTAMPLPQQTTTYQIPEATKGEQEAVAQAIQPPDFSSVKLEKLMPLLEMEPELAWQTLQDEGELSWVNYLRQVSFEQLEQTLKAIAEASPEVRDHITSFLKQRHRWLQQLIEIARKTD